MTQIQVAIAGVGRWGVHLLRNFLEHPQVEVMAVIDPKMERLENIKRLYQLSDRVLLTTDWQAIRGIKNLGAVVIATPAASHYGLITDAINWGYHVLAEKPLTLNPQECEELCLLAEQQKLQLMVDHTYLFHPGITQGQAVLAQKYIGDLRYGYATRTHLAPVRQDVDALWDLAIHDIAIFNTWLGESPVKVRATGQSWLQPGLADVVWVTLTYPGGLQTQIHLSWLNTDKQRRLVVVGSKGSLIFDEMSPQAPLTVLHGEFEQQDGYFIPVNQSQEVLEIEGAEPLKQMCDRFVQSVINNKPVEISSGRVGTELVKILAALTQSLEGGGIEVEV
ncbi:Gfo/Idh/MocA family oxidoreductase [Calothrix sp. 336/3]|uniref:Gfo/Idh/MocA family oxidoreductase n=1 Tax=Calothrix sp. 336/3 TaxID=1337936 RepID=UPI0004E3BE89|nr:Gfo/Idh/MocA family oxidoreductase [Calothrix sp. 336/3]AKG22924.1 oxidoreductase [Calothrix sp. 336/3]